MAATFTEVTLEDMEKFLRRAYNVYRPKRGESRGEVYYDLSLSKGSILIRVWTSIRPHSGMGADKGTDAIRVTLVTKGGKPLVPKGTIVKRTQNWRTSLQSRIDDLLDDYESKTEYWKKRQQDRDGETKEEAEEELLEPTPNTPRVGPHEGIFTRLQSGAWGAKIYGTATQGDIAVLETKSKSRVTVKLKFREDSGKDRFTGKYAETWTIEDTRRATDTQEGGLSLTAALVAERVLAGRGDIDEDGTPDESDEGFDAY